METTTPCQQRDTQEWFAPDNRGGIIGGKSPEQREQDVSDSLRAKLICMTRCPVRKQCMETALSYEDNNYWIWGGYSGPERQRIQDDGHLTAPDNTTLARFDRINEFIDYHLLRSEAAERWGISERGVESLLHRYIWDLRIAQGDPWVVLHEVEDSSMSDSRKNDESVRAA